MGQINCQCQYISSDDYDSVKRQPDSLPVLSTEQNEPTQILTKLTLKSTNKIIDIPLFETAKLTFGTTDDCQQRLQSNNGIQFKLEVKYRNRCVFLRDLGVGLGAFVMKRKVVRRVGNGEILMGIEDKWVVLKVLQSKQIGFSIYSAEGMSQGLLEEQQQQQIDLGGCKLLIKRTQDAKQYSIRRDDRREIWVLLGEERRIKLRDVLRLGVEIFQVASISTYLECSTIIKRY